MVNYNDSEFFDIINPVINNEEFNKTQDIVHHGITRYNHCMRVAYFSYKITKAMKLDYRQTARAAMLHDFFIDEVEDENKINKLRRHPSHAVSNAKKYFDLSDKEEDIIKTHMFPVTFTPPKYLESWIVDLVDDFAAVYEKYYTVRREVNAAMTFLVILLINIVKIK